MTDFFPAIAHSVEGAPWGYATAFAVVVALIKVWPVLQLQAQRARDKLRKEKRDDLHDCRARLDDMDRKVNNAVGQIHQLELRLVGTVGAYRILHDHLHLTDPESQALLQARAVYQSTWDGPMIPTEAVS